MQRQSTLYRTTALATCGIALFLLVEGAARLMGSTFFPPPTEMLLQLQQQWFSGPPGRLFVSDAFMEHTLTSVWRLLAGFAIAVAVGTAGGLAIGTVRVVRDSLLPVARFAGGIPPPALLPVALVLFGIGHGRQVALIAVGSLWPVLLGGMAGAASLDPVARDAARTLRLSRRTYLLKVVWPAAFPQIANGIRIAFGFSVVLMVISEMFVASSGLGFALVQAQRTFRIGEMWSTVVLIALIGIGFSALIEVVLRRPLRWHYAKEGR